MDANDIKNALESLAKGRPIFHSEADFQHALAWQLQNMFPDASIRLEVPFRRERCSAQYVDVLVQHAGKQLAIELKYKTRSYSTKLDSESFGLQNHSAHDLGRYDFLADVQRLERFVRDDRAHGGVAILLSNDQAYWSTASRTGTIDEQFRLTEGKRVSGEMRWLQHASDGTTKGGEAPITLSGKYVCTWAPYSQLQPAPGASFNYLLWSV